MTRRHGPIPSASFAPSTFRASTRLGLVLASLLIVLSATVALAAPAAPVLSGPTAIQFAYHPAGFRATVTWEPVDTAVSYQIYNADTLFYMGSVTGTSCAIYGMQNVLYHHYVLAVDSLGATSTPSNVVDILTSAPVPPAMPATFEVLPQSVFSLESSSAGIAALPVKIPFDPAQVAGDVSALRMMHLDNGVWTDVTTSVDTTRSFVLGVASPTSVFAVVEVTGSVTSTITPWAAPHGIISPQLPQAVTYGADSATFSITPDSGYHVSEVLVDGVSVGPLSSYSFSNVTQSHSIAAYFAADEITISTVTSLTGPAIVRFRRAAMFSGSVLPSTAAGSVMVYRYRMVGGSWVSVGSTAVALSDGSYRYQFVGSARGAWRLRAVYSGEVVGATTYAPSASALKTVIVR